VPAVPFSLPAFLRSLIELSGAVASSQSLLVREGWPCTPHKVIGLVHQGKQIGGTRVESCGTPCHPSCTASSLLKVV
jgi:hypothetical protein